MQKAFPKAGEMLSAVTQMAPPSNLDQFRERMMSKLTCCKPFRRALAAVAILCAAALPQLVCAQAANPWFTARLDFSAELVNLENAGVSFASASPYVTLIQQGTQVTGIQWGLGQITLNQGNLASANSLGPMDKFSMTVGNETLTFVIGDVNFPYQQSGQLGITLPVSGTPAPYISINSDLTVISQDFQTTQPFAFPVGNDPAQGRFVANSMRLQYGPGFSDPAFGLLDAISQGNNGMTIAITHDQLYNMNLGTLTISAVPEPASAVMLLIGLGAMGWMVRRRTTT